MPPQSRINSSFMGGVPASEAQRPLQVNVAIAMVREQKLEADRLREKGHIPEAIDRYQVVIKLCSDVIRKLGGGLMAEVFEEKKLEMQQVVCLLSSGGGYVPPTRRPSVPQGLQRPSPTSSGSLRTSGNQSVDNVSVPPSRYNNFRHPVTTLKIDSASWDEYTAFTRKLKEESDALRAAGTPEAVAKAVAKLREAAEIWNYVVDIPRFYFVGTLRATAREAADNYMEMAMNLQNPAGAVAAANGPASGKVEAEEMDRRVRDIIVHDTPENRVSFDEIIGAKSAKDALLSALLDRYIYKKKAENETRGVLLYGPAGTGKTMMVRGAVNFVSNLLAERAKRQAEKSGKSRAEQGDAASENSFDGDSNSSSPVSDNDTQDTVPKAITLFVLTSGHVDSKWVGEGPKFMQSLFKIAREHQPAVIFIDECDSLFSKRGEGQNEATAKIMTQFMTEVEGLTSKGNITVIAATNEPRKLDNAVLRRLKQMVYLPAPTPEDRAKIIAQQLQHMDCPNNVPEDKLRELALSKAMHNFTGADLKLVLERAQQRGDTLLHDSTSFHEVDGALEPCAEDAKGAMQGSYTKFFSQGFEFRELPVTYEYITEAAEKHYPTASDQIPVLEAWKKEIESNKK